MRVSREHEARARARAKTEMKFGKVSAGMPFTPTGVSANPRQTVAPRDGALRRRSHLISFWRTMAAVEAAPDCL